MGRLLLAVVLAAVLVGPASAAPRPAPRAARGGQIVDALGQPIFVLGANYEGPVDRAWQMWDDGLFDARAIGRDFDRARAAGVAVLRIFVQRSLADDIRAARWTKLDRVLELADQRGLRLILTFADYTEVELARLVQIDVAVARRYRGRPTIFAYDLKNEPRFGDLALAEYPPTLFPTLQHPLLVAALGETVAPEGIAAYRATDEGRRDIPQRFSDDRAYVYANVLAAYRRFLQDAQTWAIANGATSVRYAVSPDSATWDPLKGALDETIAAWMKPRLEALRAADPERLITVGHADPILASLSANGWLDYRTIHRYPPATSEGIRASMALLDDLRAALPDSPLVLGEFGFSNATVDEETSSALETEMARAACNHGAAGALKWMVNDYPKGANPRENAFGMFRADGSPKPIVGAFRALEALRPLDQPLTTHEARPPDYDLCDGHFFTQTSGTQIGAAADAAGAGYSVTNADGIPFWDAFQQLGGVPSLGYPIGRRFLLDGWVVQPLQRGTLRWRPTDQRVELLRSGAGVAGARTAIAVPSEALAPEPAP